MIGMHARTYILLDLTEVSVVDMKMIHETHTNEVCFHKHKLRQHESELRQLMSS